MKVLVLAAGYGTRLYPIITDTPKALLEIAGKPIMNHLLDRIRSINGLTEVIAVTNDKFNSHFSAWAEDNTDFPAQISIVNDGTTSPEDRLGSIGDIHYVLENHPVDDDLLVMGGDNLFDFNLDEFVVFAQQKEPNASIGLYDIGNIQEATKFGVVAVDAQHKVVSFEEKPQQPKSSLVAMCFYYFPEKTLPVFDEYLTASQKMDQAGDYIRWLSEHKGVYGFKFQGRWYDIGSIEAYEEAQKAFQDKGKHLT